MSLTNIQRFFQHRAISIASLCSGNHFNTFFNDGESIIRSELTNHLDLAQHTIGIDSLVLFTANSSVKNSLFDFVHGNILNRDF